MKTLLLWIVSISLALGVVVAQAQAAPTVTLTASPTSGLSPLSVTLTWNSTGAFSCQASGSWAGAKALSGSEVVSTTSAATYVLTCSTGTGGATLSWTAPTQNTDNSAIPATGVGSLAGFKLYHATTSAGVAAATPIVINDKAATSYVLTGLPVGTRYYGATAFNAEGVSSDLSNLISNVIVLPSGSANASVTVSVKPKPPVMVTVALQAYEVKSNAWGTALAKQAGTVALGTACGLEPIVYTEMGIYYQVPASAVNLDRPTNKLLVAKCEVT